MSKQVELNKVEQVLVKAFEDDSEISVFALLEPVTAQKVLRAIYDKQRIEDPLLAAVGESLITTLARETNDEQLGAIIRQEVVHETSN